MDFLGSNLRRLWSGEELRIWREMAAVYKFRPFIDINWCQWVKVLTGCCMFVLCLIWGNLISGLEEVEIF